MGGRLTARPCLQPKGDSTRDRYEDDLPLLLLEGEARAWSVLVETSARNHAPVFKAEPCQLALDDPSGDWLGEAMVEELVDKGVLQLHRGWRGLAAGMDGREVQALAAVPFRAGEHPDSSRWQYAGLEWRRWLPEGAGEPKLSQDSIGDASVAGTTAALPCRSIVA